MKNIGYINRAVNQRGSILIIALIIVVILSFSIISITRHTYSIHRINQRTIALEKAAATAEAGLYKIIWFFNHASPEPEDSWEGIDDPEYNKATIYSFMTLFRSTDPPNALEARNQIFGTDLAAGQTLMTFIDKDESLNENLIRFGNSRVIKLWVTAPRAEAEEGTIFTFWSTAETELPNGATVRRTALMDVNFRPDLLLRVPCGIVSGGAVAANGQLNLHWGEAWAKDGGILVPFNTTIGVPPSYSWMVLGGLNYFGIDQWTKYKVARDYIRNQNDEIIVNDPTKVEIGSLCSNYYDELNGILYQFYDNQTEEGEKTLTEKINEVLDKFAKLDDPNTGYEFWKSVAIRRGTYFQAVGKKTVRDLDGNEYSLDSVLDRFRERENEFLIFFDTTDGNPPREDGSNWANLEISGKIEKCTRGLFYVAGHLTVRGLPAPTIPIRNPAEIENDIDPEAAETQERVFHDGVIFTYGNYTNTGNPVVYGSVVCRGLYNCGGTPNLYYNAAFKDGEYYQISNPVLILTEVILSNYQ